MKKNFNPQYIANCRKQIEAAMKDDSLHWELRMCDIMTAAATAFGNSSDKEVDRMKAFLLELILSSLENQGKELDCGTEEYCHELFKESGRVNGRILEELKRVVRHCQKIDFPDLVITPALNNISFYEEVSVRSLWWNEERYCIIAEDEEGGLWHEDDFLPSSIEKFLDQIIDQDLYPHNS